MYFCYSNVCFDICNILPVYKKPLPLACDLTTKMTVTVTATESFFVFISKIVSVTRNLIDVMVFYVTGSTYTE